MGYQRSELGEIDSTYHRLTVHRDTQYIKTEVVRVASADATSPKAVPDGGRIDAQVFADSRE
jgi:hypothetical protein